MPKITPDRIPECCVIIKKEMSEGASFNEVCAKLNITKQTKHNYCNPKSPYYIPELAEAFSEGEQLSEAWWMTEGRLNLNTKNFNHVLWYMNMKNRFGWRDKVEMSDDGKDGKTDAADALVRQYAREY